MDKNPVLLKAYFVEREVLIIGGFSHPQKGHEFEIVGVDNNIPRQSVSAWGLNYNNPEAAEEIFQKHFKCSFEDAKAKDRKKHISVPETKSVAMLSY